MPDKLLFDEWNVYKCREKIFNWNKSTSKHKEEITLFKLSKIKGTNDNNLI